MGNARANRRTTTSSRSQEGKAPATGMKRDIVAVVVLAAGIVLGLSLVTFSASDTPLVARGLPAASNLVGPVGHHLATAAYGFLGFAALIVPAALVVLAARLFRARARRVTVIGTSAHVVLAVSFATLAHLFLASRQLTSFPPGGLLGRVLCSRSEALF